MNYNEVFEVLREHAIKFHQALIDGKIYTARIEQKEFLERINNELSDTAKYLLENNGDLESSKLNLPISLRNELQDIIAYANWDYEFCYDGFLDDLTQLFTKTTHELKWEYNSKLLYLTYSLDDHSWIIENLRLKAEVDFEVYNKILNELNTYLIRYREVLYEVTTGDQSGLLVLMPIDSPEIIKDLLIEVHDPRASMFYE